MIKLHNVESDEFGCMRGAALEEALKVGGNSRLLPGVAKHSLNMDAVNQIIVFEAALLLRICRISLTKSLVQLHVVLTFFGVKFSLKGTCFPALCSVWHPGGRCQGSSAHIRKIGFL